ncbi:uncharacterized protein LOC144918177 isoform X1 [Branchiostoma floridae x Branchiostoma belcheri]
MSNSDKQQQQNTSAGEKWRVKTLDEILEEKRRRKERQTMEQGSKGDHSGHLEEGELEDEWAPHRARETGTDPYRHIENGELQEKKGKEGVTEGGGSDDERMEEGLDIKPPQPKKDSRSSHHSHKDRRKDKHRDRSQRRKRSLSKEGADYGPARQKRRSKEPERADHKERRHARPADFAARGRSQKQPYRERERPRERPEAPREPEPWRRDRVGPRPEREPPRGDRLAPRADRERERPRSKEDLRRKERRDVGPPQSSRSGQSRKREGERSPVRPPRDEQNLRAQPKYESPKVKEQDEPQSSADERVHTPPREEEEQEIEVGGMEVEREEERSESSGEGSSGEESGSEGEGSEGEGSEEGEESGDESGSSSSSSEDEDSGEESGSGDDQGSERSGSVRSTSPDHVENKTHHVHVKSKFDEESGGSEEEDDQSEPPSDNEYVVADSPPESPPELKPEIPPYLPAVMGCRNVEEFSCLNRIEEGTYGVVYRAKDKKTGEIVALKRLKMEKEKEGFPITSLREINTLLKAQHPNIVTVREIVVGSNMDKIYIVMDYVEHDLKSLMETMKQPFLVGETKTLLIQLLRAVQHLHDNWILHRDLKTSNLLLSHKGILKVGDFGLAREYGSPLKPYTPIVVTLWYRAPELLLGVKEYSTHIDLWSVGCIFAEFLTMKPLWQGKSEIDQLNKIFKDLGTPSERIWPGYNELPAVKKCTFAEYPYNNLRSRFGAYLSDLGFELLNKFLTYCPSKRITAEDALKHEFFRESPQPVDPSMFPTWPAKSEQTTTRVKRGSSPRPPEGGLGYAQQLAEDGDIEPGLGFHFNTSQQGVSAKGAGFNLKF